MLTFPPFAPEKPFTTIRPSELWSMLVRDAIGQVSTFPNRLQSGSEKYKMEGDALGAAQFLLANAVVGGQIHAFVSPGNDGTFYRVPQEHWKLEGSVIEGSLSDELFCWDNSVVPPRFHNGPIFFFATDYERLAGSAVSAIKESVSEVVEAYLSV